MKGEPFTICVNSIFIMISNKRQDIIRCNSASDTISTSIRRFLGSRRSVSDVSLVSMCEIDVFFEKLNDSDDKEGNIRNIIDISTNQNFVVSSFKFDLLFSIVNDQDLNGSDIWELAFAVIDRIASFGLFFIENGLKERHILSLINHFPFPYAVKTLGKLISMSDNYKEIAFNQGILRIVENNMQSKYTSLMIWFLSCFVSNKYNQYIINLYIQYIFPFSTHYDSQIRKHSIDAIHVLFMQSEEIKLLIIEHQFLNDLISNIEEDETVLCVLIRFFCSVLDFVQINGLSKFVLLSLGFQDETTKAEGLKLLLKILQFEDIDFSIPSALMDIHRSDCSYKIKKIATDILIQHFLLTTNDERQNLLKSYFIRILFDYVRTSSENSFDVLKEALTVSMLINDLDLSNSLSDLASEIDV